MLSNKDYHDFISNLEPIITDTFIPNPSEEDVLKDKYLFNQGYWNTTQKFVYFYDKEKVLTHKDKLLSLCKKLPKYHQATDQHSGTILAFDLLVDSETMKFQTNEEVLQQMVYSEHFANLLCACNIATIQVISDGNNSAFIIILDKNYREFLE